MTARVYSLDTMRVVASIGVIFIHVTSPAVALANEHSFHWLSTAALQSLFFYAVPMFLMASGYFLLEPKAERISVFYSKRLTAVFIPSVFWIAAYLYWPALVFGDVLSLTRSIEQLLWGFVSFHLYFLFAIVGIYILTPFLRNMLKQDVQPNMVFGFSVLWIVFWCINFSITKYLDVWARTAASLPFWFMGYFILGYAYRRYQETKSLPLSKRALFILCTVAIVGNVASKYIEASLTTGEKGFMYSNSYFSVFLALYAIVLFPLLLNSKTIETIGRLKIVQALSSASFGIFLIHMMALEGYYYSFEMPRPYTALSCLFDSLVLYVVSAFVILLLQQLPIVNVFVGGKNVAFKFFNESSGPMIQCKE